MYQDPLEIYSHIVQQFRPKAKEIIFKVFIEQNGQIFERLLYNLLPSFNFIDNYLFREF